MAARNQDGWLHIEVGEAIGFPLGQELATDFILASLPPSYGNFISNYHMHGAEKGLNELCGMLKTAEGASKKAQVVAM